MREEKFSTRDAPNPDERPRASECLIITFVFTSRYMRAAAGLLNPIAVPINDDRSSFPPSCLLYTSDFLRKSCYNYPPVDRKSLRNKWCSEKR